jgi:hypothetical protein
VACGARGLHQGPPCIGRLGAWSSVRGGSTPATLGEESNLAPLRREEVSLRRRDGILRPAQATPRRGRAARTP